MKTEEILERQAYDKRYPWRCTNCDNHLRVEDIRWGVWQNGKGKLTDASECCDAETEPRI